MVADADILPLTIESNMKNISFEVLLAQLTNVINIVTTRPYMSPYTAEKSIELLIGVVEALGIGGK